MHFKHSKEPIPGGMEEERELKNYKQFCICPQCGYRVPIEDLSIPCHKIKCPECDSRMVKK